MADGNDEGGTYITDTQWLEICEKAKFRCSQCGEYPLADDIEVFFDEGMCGRCAARWRAIYNED